MTTLDDKATEAEEYFRDLALREQALHASRARIIPRGERLSCGETELPTSDALFCCPECQHDWGRKERARQIAGRA